jgi:hypothetical protein
MRNSIKRLDHGGVFDFVTDRFRLLAIRQAGLSRFLPEQNPPHTVAIPQ